MTVFFRRAGLGFQFTNPEGRQITGTIPFRVLVECFGATEAPVSCLEALKANEREIAAVAKRRSEQTHARFVDLGAEDFPAARKEYRLTIRLAGQCRPTSASAQE